MVNLLGIAQEGSGLIVSSLIPEDARVLNIGRANRRFVRQLKARRPAAKVVQLRSRVSRGELEALPYDPRSFHAVTSLFALDLWRNGPDAFSEIARTLAPGGVLAFSELSAQDVVTDRERASRITSFITNRPSVADYYRWLGCAGFRVQEAVSSYSGRHGLLIIAEKVSQ
jgi:SAM-dependent methyltransferase